MTRRKGPKKPDNWLTRTPEERFWEKVNVGGEDECWEWTAHCNHAGYGTFGVASDGVRESWLAHRFSYQVHFGEFDKTLCVCHHCDNPPCVNPKHLFLGTRIDNNLDKDRKGRNTKGRAFVFNETHPATKLSVEDVKEIRRLFNAGQYNCTQLGKMYNMSFQHIWALTHGKERKYVD